MASIEAQKGEIWKRVKVNGVPVKRLVSNKGRVYNTNKSYIVKLSDNGNGYLFVNLLNDGRRVATEYIHRLVAQNFIPNPDNLPQVNHIDGDKTNNVVENLEWVSGKENIRKAHETGAMIKRTSNGKINVLTVEQVELLYRGVKDGRGISEMAREMNIPRTTASSIINKRSRCDITNLIDEDYD